MQTMSMTRTFNDLGKETNLEEIHDAGTDGCGTRGEQLHPATEDGMKLRGKDRGQSVYP